MYIFDTEYVRTEESGSALFPCSSCNSAVSHGIFKDLYFVTALEFPLFPHKTVYYAKCRICGCRTDISQEQYKEMSKKEEDGAIKLADYQTSRREGIKFCRQCGGRVKAKASFCIHCGVKIPEK